MQKLMLTLLVGIVALAPAFAVAPVSSGAPGSTKPNSPLEGAGGPGAGPAAGSGTSTGPATPSEPRDRGATTTPGAADPSRSPSASPAQTSDDFAQYTTPADCEKASGVWLTATSRCVRR